MAQGYTKSGRQHYANSGHQPFRHPKRCTIELMFDYSDGSEICDSQGLRVEKFTVRRIDESDLEDFRRVRLEALLLHPEAFGASYEDWNQKPAQFFGDLLRENHMIGGFDIHNNLQGIIGVRRSDSPKLSHVATIWGVYVRPEMRGSGLSRKLMEAALEATYSAKIVKLSVLTSNHTARALYRSYGFTEWAIDTAALCVNGVFHDEFLMKRESELSA
ncbi:GNAT family N-acetyltransferase [Xenorhabdus sp. 12]|uniref:GNAT family N-acetyltransferase n=1 Tax=Xenorhabdus santafensis TaxID=2582833 RepID=A0ABU4S9L8_9GAMM|nr:N-acetyltransferase [Xenorhabdus sp. 12]MDX7987451.1 GNAT family N-acetyltransferase [Xenorhabdus sp. 12]